jgi:hypothetical protein
MNPSDRLEWYKQASANLRKYLSELEAALVSGQFADTKPTDYLITVTRPPRLGQDARSSGATAMTWCWLTACCPTAPGWKLPTTLTGAVFRQSS